MYQVLELPEQASAEDIRRAYLRLVRLTHPDRTPDPAAHRRYLLVNEAYDTLRQPSLRARYDAQLQARRQPARPVYAQPFGGNAFQVLRVPYSATPAQIERAYRHWYRVLHMAPAADPAMQRQRADLEHAYATLTSAELRRQHLIRLQQQPPSGLDREAAFYARYAPQARLICRLLLAFAAALLLDFVWLRDYPHEVVQRIELRQVEDRRGVIDSYYHIVTPSVSFRADYTYPPGTDLHLRRSALFGRVRAYYLSGTDPERALSYADDWFSRALALIAGVVGAIAAWGNRRHSSAKTTCDAAAVAAIIAIMAVYLLVRL
nr:J domain-containing protein [Hymenobacter sp. 15J16-1T3B]